MSKLASLIVHPNWKLKALLEGRGYHVDVGAFSTPIVGGGNGTIIDQDQPECGISVPSGTTIIPIRISVQCQTPLLATDADESEIVIAWDQAAAIDAGTSTAETALKMNDNSSVASLCTCYSAYTGNCTNPTLSVELARAVATGDINGTTPANALWGKLDLLYEPLLPPLIVGPASLIVYFGGTVATSGFAQVEWLEFLTGDL